MGEGRQGMRERSKKRGDLGGREQDHGMGGRCCLGVRKCFLMAVLPRGPSPQDSPLVQGQALSWDNSKVMTFTPVLADCTLVPFLFWGVSWMGQLTGTAHCTVHPHNPPLPGPHSRQSAFLDCSLFASRSWARPTKQTLVI